MRTTFCKVMFGWVAALGWCAATAQAQLNPPAMSADEEAGRLRVNHVGLVAADTNGLFFVHLPGSIQLSGPLISQPPTPN